MAASATVLPRATRLRQLLNTDTGWSIVGRVGSLLLTGLLSIVIARRLGPTGQGVYALALLVPGVLSVLTNWGVPSANVYNTGSGRLSVSRASRATMVLTLLATLLSCVLITVMSLTGAMAAAVPGLPRVAIAVAMASLPLLLMRDAMQYVLLGLQRIRLFSMVTLAYGISLLALTTAVLMAQVGVVGALVAYDVSAAGSLAMVMWTIRRDHPSYRPAADRAALRATVSFGVKSSVAGAVTFLNYRLDAFIVNHYHGTSQVGIYAVSARLAEVLWVVPLAVGAVIFSRAAAGDRRDEAERTTRVFWATLQLGAACAGVMAMVGALVISVLYTHAFADAYVPMLLLLPGAVLQGGATILGYHTMGKGVPMAGAIAAVAALVVTLVFDFLLIPAHGISGASIASTLSYATATALMVGYYLRISGQSVRHFASGARWWTATSSEVR